MRKIFTLASHRAESPAVAAQSWSGQDKSRAGYHIRDKDLGKIHKAARLGDVARVQQLLLLGKSGVNDRDKMDRYRGPRTGGRGVRVRVRGGDPGGGRGSWPGMCQLAG